MFAHAKDTLYMFVQPLCLYLLLLFTPKSALRLILERLQGRVAMGRHLQQNTLLQKSGGSDCLTAVPGGVTEICPANLRQKQILHSVTMKIS